MEHLNLTNSTPGQSNNSEVEKYIQQLFSCKSYAQNHVMFRDCSYTSDAADDLTAQVDDLMWSLNRVR